MTAASGAGHDPAAALGVPTVEAAGSGGAFDASVQTAVAAEVAAGSGDALAAAGAIIAAAEAALGSGLAFNASTSGAGVPVVPAIRLTGSESGPVLVGASTGGPAYTATVTALSTLTGSSNGP
jgi:hypothetical protein